MDELFLRKVIGKHKAKLSAIESTKAIVTEYDRTYYTEKSAPPPSQGSW